MAGLHSHCWHQVGPLGSGAGTTELVWRRAGDTTFEPQPVGHVHSDPLETLLEDGWLGTLAILAALAAGAVLLIRGGQPRCWQRTAVAGPALGLLTLALHACADFLVSNEAIALTAVLLLVVLAIGATATTAAPASEALPPAHAHGTSSRTRIRTAWEGRRCAGLCRHPASEPALAGAP